MRTKQVRPDKLDFEYELYIYKDYDSVMGKDFIAFDFRTKKVFESFAYRINVEPNITADRNELSFNIEGLSAPLLDFSKTGPAYFIYKLYDFRNSSYTLHLSKYRKNKTLFRFDVLKSGIKLTHDPDKKFIKVITEENFVS